MLSPLQNIIVIKRDSVENTFETSEIYSGIVQSIGPNVSEPEITVDSEVWFYKKNERRIPGDLFYLYEDDVLFITKKDK